MGATVYQLLVTHHILLGKYFYIVMLVAQTDHKLKLEALKRERERLTI